MSQGTQQKFGLVNPLALAACLNAIHKYEKKNDILVSWLFHGRDQAASLMNIQLLEGADGEYTLCLTCGDQRFEKETAVKVLDLIIESIMDITK